MLYPKNDGFAVFLLFIHLDFAKMINCISALLVLREALAFKDSFCFGKQCALYVFLQEMSSYSVQALDGSGQPVYDNLASDGPGFTNRTTVQLEDHEL